MDLSGATTDDCPVFVSCGSLIIDDIRYEDGTEMNNVLGGAGVFAIYGNHHLH